MGKDYGEMHVPHSEYSRPNDRDNPVYSGVAGPGKNEETDRDKYASNDRRGKTVLGFRATNFSSRRLPLFNQSHVILMNNRITASL